jgi:tungstate transport system ATP-binding protein
VDIENRAAIEAIMREIRDAGQSAIIFCTHDLTQAARLTQTRLHLSDGRLNGTDHENTFPAAVRCKDNGLWGCVGPRWRVPLPSDLPAGGRITIDPRRIEIAPPQQTQGRSGECPGRLIQMVEDGDCVRLMVDVGVPLTIILSSRAYRDLALRIGDTVAIYCPAEALAVN